MSVISVMNDAFFDEFLSKDELSLDTAFLYAGRREYLAAVEKNKIWNAIRRQLDLQLPDVVAVAGWSFPESLAAIAWARANNRGIVMMSDSQVHDGRRNAVREAIKSRVVAACDAALVAGSRHADYITKLGMPAENVFLGYDVVDNEHFFDGAELARANAIALRAARGLPDRYLLASARFIPKKNLVSLIQAFARARQSTKAQYSLVILGDGEERPLLEKAIADFGVVDSVYLLGFKSYAELPLYYGLADAFIHVSLAEQWGLVVNEAAAARLPLIVSRACGSAAELVFHNRNGYLVDPLDPNDIQNAIERILVLDAPARHRMGIESRKIVGEWGLNRFTASLALAAVCAEGAAPRRLAPWDTALLRAISRRYISDVA